MIKKFTLLLVMLLGVVGSINAKSKTTTLWEGTDTGADIEVAMNKLVKGATLNLTFNWADGEYTGAQFTCKWYNSSTSEWVKIRNWQWVNKGESYSFTLTDGEFDAITSDKLYFTAEVFDKMKFTKITQTETITPTSTGANLLSENWVVAVDGWENRNFAAQTTAKIGDIIQIEVTVAGGYKYTEVQVKDSEGSDLENTSKYVGNFNEETSATFEFEINNINDLEKIQSTGFRINASNHATIRSIKLLSYADSYDAVSITVGSDGVATYSNGGKNVQISACDALKAYYASAVTTGSVTLTELIGCIPANTGVIVYGNEGTYTVPVGGEGWPSITKNYLQPTGDNPQDVARSVEGTYHYIFAKHGANKPGFYLLGSDYSETYTEDEVEKTRNAHRLAAHKAYLETDTDLSVDAPSVGSRGLSLDFGDGTTAIWSVKEDKVETGNIREDGVYYTLQGTRVQNPSKGLYILNGKKIFIK